MRYAAFLRAVNVAGTQLSMGGLKDMLAALGFENAQTLLQSGNAVFETAAQNAVDVETLLERETERRLKVRTEYFVRNEKELARIIEQNPFPREAKDDPARLVLVFLKSKPNAKSVSDLQSRIKGPETVRAGNRHLYITYPDGQGRSKLTNAVIEKTLDMRGNGAQLEHGAEDGPSITLRVLRYLRMTTY